MASGSPRASLGPFSRTRRPTPRRDLSRKWRSGRQPPPRCVFPFLGKCGTRRATAGRPPGGHFPRARFPAQAPRRGPHRLRSGCMPPAGRNNPLPGRHAAEFPPLGLEPARPAHSISASGSWPSRWRISGLPAAARTRAASPPGPIACPRSLAAPNLDLDPAFEAPAAPQVEPAAPPPAASLGLVPRPEPAARLVRSRCADAAGALAAPVLPDCLKPAIGKRSLPPSGGWLPVQPAEPVMARVGQFAAMEPCASGSGGAQRLPTLAGVEPMLDSAFEQGRPRRPRLNAPSRRPRQFPAASRQGRPRPPSPFACPGRTEWPRRPGSPPPSRSCRGTFRGRFPARTSAPARPARFRPRRRPHPRCRPSTWRPPRRTRPRKSTRWRVSSPWSITANASAVRR